MSTKIIGHFITHTRKHTHRGKSTCFERNLHPQTLRERYYTTHVARGISNTSFRWAMKLNASKYEPFKLWQQFGHSEGNVETLFTATCEIHLRPRTHVHNKDGHSFLQQSSFIFFIPKKDLNPSASYDEMALQHPTMLLTPWLYIRGPEAKWEVNGTGKMAA